ncbi:MAG: histidine phosphatase family protein [Fastidiosipilaceae bacterium]|jgi:broad specificity phosphatase PhoE
MIKISLIRHARPDFPLEERYCLGQSDMPLGKIGHLQGCLLKAFWQEKSIPVFSSPLKRAKETAEYIASGQQPITIVQDLQELNAGIWDGYCFSEIKRKWPELYAKRSGAFANDLIPGAEDHHTGRKRFVRAVGHIIQTIPDGETEIAVVAHATVIQLLLADILSCSMADVKKYKLPYAGWVSIIYDEGKLSLLSGPSVARPKLSDDLCLELLRTADCPINVIRHCQKVADTATEIGRQLNEKNLRLDLNVLRESAYLHDMLRMEKDHEKATADLLSYLGYPDHAKLIAIHNTAQNEIILNESSLLYIADKMTQNDQIVPLQKRFDQSFSKCLTAEAKEAHQKRKNYAFALSAQINKIIGGKVS